ncbi:hypothetical protein [Actinomyces wuliandei]|nr:hypothetical protein [Actinomyces wuliandei]
MRTTVFLFHPHLDVSVVNARLARGQGRRGRRRQEHVRPLP